MSAREELDQTLASIGILEDQISDIHTKLDPLTKKRDELIWAVIVEEKLFSGLTWSLIDYQTLECYIRDEEAIQKLFSGFYIHNLAPSPGISTSISSDVFCFYFDDPKLMPPLVSKLGIVIDSSEITSRLHARRREVESLEILCHLFGIREK